MDGQKQTVNQNESEVKTQQDTIVEENSKQVDITDTEQKEEGKESNEDNQKDSQDE